MAVDTPQFRYWRRIWWFTVVAALVLTAASFGLLSLAKMRTASNIVLALAYVAIFATLYIDWFKIRPMRKEAYQAALAGKSGKAAKAAKADKTPDTEKPAKADSAAGADKTPDTADKQTTDSEGEA